MNTTQSYDLCMKLLHTETEKEIKQILKSLGFWDDDSCWNFLGDSPANYSIAGNQQSEPVPALVEKLVNSTDAVLTNACKEVGIDPKSHKAPDNMFEAVEKFFGVKDGKLENISSSERTKLADKIHLVATGKMQHDPCYTIIDRGEGQTPDGMPDTLLSLPGKSKTNKSSIKFVQGIFNMGGTGVLRFCGEENFQLIITKRNPKILTKKINEDSMWGFTIVRRRKPKGIRESSAYEYLIPNSKILRFDAKSIPVMPGKYPEPYSKELEFGTCIKLYEYKIGGFKANAILDLNYELSKNFLRMPIPIRIEERRVKGVVGRKFKGHTFETTLAGMSVRLDADRSNVLEENFPLGGTITVNKIGKIPYKIYAFKADNAEKRKRYHGGSEIVLTLNGQKHGKIDKALFKRNGVNLDYLENDLMVILDCSNISSIARECLFLASRDRLTKGEERTQLERALSEELGDNDQLEALNLKRKEEETKNAIKDDKTINETLQKLLKHVIGLDKNFPWGGCIQKETDFDWKKKLGKYHGERNPTFFRLQNNSKRINLKCPVNGTTTIVFETDAINDYFSRIRKPGKYFLQDPILEKSTSLANGIFKLKIQAPENSKFGDKIPIRFRVEDREKKKPWKFRGTITISQPSKTKPGFDGNPRDPHEYTRFKKPREGDKDESGIQGPNIIPVKEQDWEKYEMSKISGCRIKISKESFDVFVNVDNEYLKNEIIVNKEKHPDYLIHVFTQGLALCAVGMYHVLQNAKEDEGLPIQNKVGEASDGLSMVILPMINNLGKEVKKSQ